MCVGFKPSFELRSRTYRGHAIQDVIRSNDSDKNLHDHGQSESEFSEVIKRLTDEGSTALDPFAGGGSVAAAALKLGRKYTGIDIERKHIETTRCGTEDVLG